MKRLTQEAEKELRDAFAALPDEKWHAVIYGEGGPYYPDCIRTQVHEDTSGWRPVVQVEDYDEQDDALRFIEAAHNHVGALLAELDELRATVKEGATVIERLKSANHLEESLAAGLDPDTEWDNAWEAADALLAKAKGGEPTSR